MRGYSKLAIVGNLGKDPEMSYRPDGTALTKFSVAVNRKRQDQELTDWYNVTAWGKLAETANQYLHKGSKVLVNGRLESREYEGKTYWDLIANDVVFLDSREQSESILVDEDDILF